MHAGRGDASGRSSGPAAASRSSGGGSSPASVQKPPRRRTPARGRGTRGGAMFSPKARRAGPPSPGVPGGAVDVLAEREDVETVVAGDQRVGRAPRRAHDRVARADLVDGAVEPRQAA